MNTPYTTITTDSLKMVFPQETQYTKCEIEVRFHKTLRIPDDNKKYSLPPSLGHFPLHHVDDYAEKLPAEWKSHGGIFLPMFQAEAMWVSFHSKWPFALKIAAGKINALSGDQWTPELIASIPSDKTKLLKDLTENKISVVQYAYLLELLEKKDNSKEQDYVVVPSQPWLDGFNVGKGIIRQFIAVPLDSGYTVEEQLTGNAEHGGLQIMAYPMKKSEYEKLENAEIQAKLKASLANTVLRSARSISNSNSGFMLTASCGAAAAASEDYADEGDSMGMGAGGFMKQEIFKDKYGFEVWDQTQSQKVFVHLLNSLQYENVTGKKITSQLNKKIYSSYGYPWFDFYSEEAALDGSKKLAKIDSIASLQAKNNENILGHDQVSMQPHMFSIKTIKNGKW